MIVRRGRPTQSVEPCSQPGGHDAGAGTSIERRVVLSRSSTLYDVRHETAAAADTEAAAA